jgi:hypothetical protein
MERTLVRDDSRFHASTALSGMYRARRIRRGSIVIADEKQDLNHSDIGTNRMRARTNETPQRERYFLLDQLGAKRLSSSAIPRMVRLWLRPADARPARTAALADAAFHEETKSSVRPSIR